MLTKCCRSCSLIWRVCVPSSTLSPGSLMALWIEISCGRMASTDSSFGSQIPSQPLLSAIFCTKYNVGWPVFVYLSESGGSPRIRLSLSQLITLNHSLWRLLFGFGRVQPILSGYFPVHKKIRLFHSVIMPHLGATKTQCE